MTYKAQFLRDCFMMAVLAVFGVALNMVAMIILVVL